MKPALRQGDLPCLQTVQVKHLRRENGDFRRDEWPRRGIGPRMPPPSAERPVLEDSWRFPPSRPTALKRVEAYALGRRLSREGPLSSEGRGVGSP